MLETYSPNGFKKFISGELTYNMNWRKEFEGKKQRH